MKSHFTLILLAVVTASTSCTNLAHRIAYGPTASVTIPKTPSQAVGEAVQVKKTIDDYSKEKKQQDRQEKEDRYAAIQGQEFKQGQYSELKANVGVLETRLDQLEAINKDVQKENDALYKRIYALEQESGRLKAENETYKRSFSSVIERITILETPPEVATSKPVASVIPKPTTASTHEITENYGEMTVDGSTSVRKATNGTISVQSGHTRALYTAPVATPHRAPRTPRASQQYITGPRGGCYYYTGSGRKEYVDRNLCN